VPWREQTRTIGRAVGRAAEADAIVEDVEAQFDTARADHPAFTGSVGIVATRYAGTVFIYSPQDARGRFMARLGFVDVPEISARAGDGFGSDVSFERLDLLDVDVLVWIVDDVETDVRRFDEEPLYSRLPVQTEGRDVFVENLSELGGATSFVSVLSLPVLLEGLVPMLAAAVDGDPATPVPTL
jgi:iron complex transport system substrate-binding protein